MSFTFHWPRFSDQFHYDAIQMLNTALNKGNKPPIIADKIEVVELEMGTQPPELEIRDIGDLTMDQFRGIFRLTYAGDAHLVLRTKVQANPLNHKHPDIDFMTGSRGMLAAKEALVVPMLLRLSHFKLSSYVVLVVSKQKGITIVFKTDPLQSVDINSTFDSIAVIQKFIQREIEGQLRQMFREDLPGIIHRLSQQWVKAKVEIPPPRPHVGHHSAPPSLTRQNVHMLNSASLPLPRTPSPSISRTQLTRRTTRSSLPRRTSTPPPAPLLIDPDVFDPTYGLRPEGIPAKSAFRGFQSLFSPSRGLADLEELDDESAGLSEDLDTTYDVLDWGGMSPSVAEAHEQEYERMPAVGGGTIVRPRVIHSQSPPNVSSHSTAAVFSAQTELSYNPFSAAFASAPSPSSSRSTSPSPSHSLSTPPSSTSIYHELTEPQSLGANIVHELSMLAHSNHTLSPYTRSLSHYAVRSGPPRPPAVGTAVARKGKRRRTYRIGGGTSKARAPDAAEVEGETPAPGEELSTSEFDAGDMDVYFRRIDLDGEYGSTGGHPSLRHRRSSRATSLG
ncbi:unnamed protein product [Mycena citricolor]|uniref:Mitochondrial distribution and morphology protein 34 n=1 Tax=Mycena citricolor TaxID=2018698 RepID=A0AAD2GS01_9AGAR|nr:unnamed protein product [Mycena citricolor]